MDEAFTHGEEVMHVSERGIRYPHLCGAGSAGSIIECCGEAWFIGWLARLVLYGPGSPTLGGPRFVVVHLALVYATAVARNAFMFGQRAMMILDWHEPFSIGKFSC